jgi:hypothetical protein
MRQHYTHNDLDVCTKDLYNAFQPIGGNGYIREKTPEWANVPQATRQLRGQAQVGRGYDTARNAVRLAADEHVSR